MKKLIENAFSDVKKNTVEINKRLNAIYNTFHEVFPTDYHVEQFEGYFGTAPHYVSEDDEFTMYFKDNEIYVDNYPVRVLDYSEEEMRDMWTVIYYDLQIQILQNMINREKKVLADYAFNPDADLKDYLYLTVKKNLDEKVAHLGEYNASRERILKYNKDADVLSRIFI